MPRQDVPYGDAICRLKERIAEIWDKLGQKLHSINGVEGDGAGNVEIVSGDAAVVIDSDQIGHRIEVSLDSSKLPAAAVSSVNGQTGAVRLDAGNIPSEGNSNVQTDLDENKAAINDCFDSITSEQVARQNADSTLQTNINAVSASIPEMSTTPDPYKGVERDAQGRAFAADPASGATDKTLVTANWVSQTGDSAPNNLIHKIGDETKIGKLTFETDRPEGVAHQYTSQGNTDAYTKRIIQRIVPDNGDAVIKYLVIDSRNDNYGIASVKYVNGILQLTYTAIAGTFVPTFRIFQKDGSTYIGMDMPYHIGFTLQQLTYADNYGNNVYYSPLIDEYSTDYTEVAHT